MENRHLLAASKRPLNDIEIELMHLSSEIRENNKELFSAAKRMNEAADELWALRTKSAQTYARLRQAAINFGVATVPEREEAAAETAQPKA